MHEKNTKKNTKTARPIFRTALAPTRAIPWSVPWSGQCSIRGPNRGPLAVWIAVRNVVCSWSASRGIKTGDQARPGLTNPGRPGRDQADETRPRRQGQGDQASETKQTRGSDKAKERKVYPVRQILALRNCDAKFSRFEKLSRNTTKSFRAQTVQLLPNTL